jgi:hypothetical protein
VTRWLMLAAALVAVAAGAYLVARDDPAEEASSGVPIERLDATPQPEVDEFPRGEELPPLEDEPTATTTPSPTGTAAPTATATVEPTAEPVPTVTAEPTPAPTSIGGGED